MMILKNCFRIKFEFDFYSSKDIIFQKEKLFTVYSEMEFTLDILVSQKSH